MKAVLAAVIVAAFLISGCVAFKWPGAKQSQASPAASSSSSQKQPDTSAGIQPSQQATFSGIQPNQPGGFSAIQPNQPGSLPGNQSSSGMGALPGSQSGSGMGALPGSQSGSAVGALPGNQSSSGMVSLKDQQSGQGTINKAPAFGTGQWDYLNCDSYRIDVGQAVVLSWRVSNADTLTLDVGGAVVITDLGKGPIVTVPKGRVAAVVVPDITGKYKFKLTAANSYGTATRSCELDVLSSGQSSSSVGSDRVSTFMVYPEKIKKGEIVHVYWNVTNADHVYLEDDITGTKSLKPDEQARVSAYGVRYYYPFQDTTFILKFGNGQYMPDSKYQEYGKREIIVDVE